MDNHDLNMAVANECQRKCDAEDDSSYLAIKSLLEQGADPNTLIKTVVPIKFGFYLSTMYGKKRSKVSHKVSFIELAALSDNNAALRALTEDPRLDLRRLYNDPDEEYNDVYEICVRHLNFVGLQLLINHDKSTAQHLIKPWFNRYVDMSNILQNISQLLQTTQQD